MIPDEIWRPSLFLLLLQHPLEGSTVQYSTPNSAAQKQIVCNSSIDGFNHRGDARTENMPCDPLVTRTLDFYPCSPTHPPIHPPTHSTHTLTDFHKPFGPTWSVHSAAAFMLSSVVFSGVRGVDPRHSPLALSGGRRPYTPGLVLNKKRAGFFSMRVPAASMFPQETLYEQVRLPAL